MVGSCEVDEANTSLKELYISENNIGDEGASALADALKATLTLCGNCSSDFGEGTVAFDLVVHDMISCWRDARRERAAFGLE